MLQLRYEYKGVLMSVNDIKHMQLIESLCDSFVHIDATQSSLWHKEILENRTKQIQEGTVKTYTLAELKLQR